MSRMAITKEKVVTSLKHYFSKWTGEAKAGPAKFASPLFIFVTMLGGFAAVGVMSAAVVLSEDLARVWLVVLGSHGATMVLVFGAPTSPFSQPRNVLIGNLIASTVGVACRIWIAQPLGNIGLALPVCVCISYVLMHVTRSLNPPAGGTAALAVVSSPDIERVGWRLILPAVLFGAVFILIACVFINLIPGQRYPKYWIIEREAVTDCCNAVCCRKHKEEEESGDDSHEKNDQKIDPESGPADMKTQSNESGSPGKTDPEVGPVDSLAEKADVDGSVLVLA